MSGRADARDVWPALPLDAWRDTCETLHMWTQVVGKVRLELAPWINHCWGSALYVTTRGLTTSPIPYGAQTFAIDFDFVEHALRVTTASGASAGFALEPMPVASFYRKTMDVLRGLDIHVRILARPVEVEHAIPFALDQTHASYDAAAARRFWSALLSAAIVFAEFRARFVGKSSPVHFFWGAFDLAVTRFSGRTAPPHPGGAPNCADWVMREAYSHEVSSAGFWPGIGLGEPAFYSYAYPEPEGYRSHPLQPAEAYYHEDLREFVLPYAAVRASLRPDATLLQFLQSTYEAAAHNARWDRATLERPIEIPPGRKLRSARRDSADPH
jgi:hypothetical protein